MVNESGGRDYRPGEATSFSGQISVVPDSTSDLGIKVVSPNDIRGQIKQSLANVDAVLERPRMSRKNLLTLRFFTTDIDGFLANYEVYVEWIKESGTRVRV